MSDRQQTIAGAGLTPLVLGLLVLVAAGVGLAITLSGQPLIAAAVIIGILFAAITFLNAELGLVVLIVMLFLRISDILVNNYGLPSLARPFIILLVLAAFMKWGITRYMPRGWLRALVLVALYGIVVFTSVFYAADSARAVNVIDDFTKDATIAILITMLLQRGPALRQVTWALLLAGIFTGSISVYQFLTKTFDNNYWGFAEAPILAIVGSNEGNRSAGMLGSPNYYAQILVMLVPLALNQLWEEKSILLKLLAAWSAVVCTLGIIFTYSRGGFFSLAVVVVAVLIYRRLNLIYTFLMVAATILILMLVPNPFLQRMQTIPDILLGRSTILEEASFRGRASEMIVAVQMFADHPLLGVGVDNYPVYYQSYSRKLGLDSRTEQRQAHDLYLRTAAETGLFGLFTFGLIVFVMIKSVVDAWRMLREAEQKKYASLAVAYGISILGFMVDSIFTNLAFPRYFWILAGIAFALPTVARDVINLKKEPVPQT